MTEMKNTSKEAPLAGRVALVTGAGKRLGRAVALRLGEEGAGLAVHYRKSEVEALEVVRTIRDAGGRAESFAGELTSVEDIRRMVYEVGHEMGRLDILVNSAANFLPSSVISTTEKVWDDALNTNLKAPFFISQAAAQLLKRSRGVIINFADTGGLLGWPGYIAHSISKAGVIMLTRALAKAMAPEVRVNAIAPGTITMPGDPPEWEADFAKIAPLQHSGTPADIVAAVSYLVHAEFVTGQVLVVDGGRVL
jgi:NAD(P)-dependent dehydrogenase (short-subunit alcohol dehydrogenase family)